jgi:uncharacterized protein (TIGR03437 family)
MRFTLAIFAFSTIAFAQAFSPFGFLPNSGQFPAAVKFVHYGIEGDNFLYLTRDSFVLDNGIRIQLANISPSAQPQAGTPLPVIYNYYEGNNPARWITNAQEFSTVPLSGNVYPGIAATWTTSLDSVAPILGRGTLILTIAANADPSPIQLNVLYTGSTATAFSPSEVWFTGGNIPGVFSVGAQATQTSGTTTSSVACNLVIDNSSTLSVQLPHRDSSLPTTVVITFPDYDFVNSPAAPGYFAAAVLYPTSFGQDGSLPNTSCGAMCSYAVVAEVNAAGLPTWVTVLGGSGGDGASNATPVASGVAVSGETGSSDFPITPGAPQTSLGSSGGAFLAYLDAGSGQLLNSTYAGVPGTAYVGQQIVSSASDVAIGGSYAVGSSYAGFIQLWQPILNRFTYSYLTPAAIADLAFDASSNLYFATILVQPAAQPIALGELDPSGNLIGSMVNLDVPLGALAAAPLLQVAGSNNVWIAYDIDPAGQNDVFQGYVSIARVIPALGQVAVASRVSQQGYLANIGLTPESNLKMLVTNPAGAETTTPDAALVAACPNTSYFAVLSPAAQIVYATYVPSTGFNFANQNESQSAPPPTVSCFQSTAGRFPSTTGAAPGELITIVGGGFGPLATTYAALGTGRTYPTTLDGFQITIGGYTAPVIALARGLIAVQVPFEASSFDQAVTLPTIDVTNAGARLPSVSVGIEYSAFNLFDTGNRDNATNLPALAALNQDGSVNTVDNPASAGSVISLFGSGLGVLNPPLPTGGLNPIPPGVPLSLSPLTAICNSGCSQVLYLGSAPGLSTSVVQLNVQISAAAAGTGVQPVPIAIGLARKAWRLTPPSQPAWSSSSRTA